MTVPIVELSHHARGFALADEAVIQYARWIMRKVSALDPAMEWHELSLVLTDDRIRGLNREWFDRDRITDVISFAYPPVPPETGHSGEVIVNVRQAFEEGRLRNGPDEELAFYLAHGCHHLMGAEDDTPDRKRAMLDLERRWLSEARDAGLLGPFFL